ncbi:unnamed protein product [Parnassius apollo]|uniref:(apollo) hypothetical protein n=1 Tax=Parnassius apollo TaxID=110799 RepID=A0A8S3XSM1_PARAO|nr:unnamed protein product [Parnassius apollo]
MSNMKEIFEKIFTEFCIKDIRVCISKEILGNSRVRSILTCTRLLWRGRRFFEEEHAAHAMSAVLRVLAHYAAINSNAAVDVCLHFLCDLINGISLHESASPLSHQSAYSVEQLLACLNALTQCFNKNPNNILCSALVLDALISYQPPNLVIRACTANALAQVLKSWLELLVGALNHAVLVDDNGMSGMLLVVTSQIGMDVLRLEKLLGQGNQGTDFIQSILTDDQEINALKESASEMKTCTLRVASELIVFVKDYQDQINTEEYSMFLKFLLNFLQHNTNSYTLSEFCDTLFAKGYLTMLPKCHIRRNDSNVRKLSTLILGEMLIVLAKKYLVNETENNEMCAEQIHLSQWLKAEDSLPEDLAKEFEVWELLLNVLVKCTENTIIHNCMEALKLCLEEADYESKQVFATTIWSKLPEVLSKALIDYNFEIGTNICYLMDIATNLLPTELDQTICLKTAVVLTVLFSKSNLEATYESIETRNHYEYVCLKLCFVLLCLAHDKNDNRVLLTYTNREGFLQGVLLATNHVDDRVACAALELLCYVVRFFARNNYQDSENQSAAGWKTLSSIFKHAVVYKRDSKLAAILASQPWTHTLIRFQITQNVTREFLTFAHGWLTLLEMIIRKSQEGRKRYMSKYNPVTKTLILIKNNLDVEDELKELKQEIIQIIDNIAEMTSITLK